MPLTVMIFPPLILLSKNKKIRFYLRFFLNPKYIPLNCEIISQFSGVKFLVLGYGQK